MILEKLKSLIAKQFDIADENTITPETNFEEDLHADSLDFVDMICMLEEEFDIHTDDESLTKIKTVGDVVELLEKNLDIPTDE